MSTILTNAAANQAANQTNAVQSSSSTASHDNVGKHGDAFASMLSSLKSGLFQGGERVRFGRMQRFKEQFATNQALLAKKQDAKQRQQELDQEEEDKKAQEKKELERELRNKELTLKEERLQDEAQDDLSKLAVNMAAVAQPGSPFARLVSSLAASGSSSSGAGSLADSLAGGSSGGFTSSGSQQSVALTSVQSARPAVNGYAIADASSQGAQAAQSMAAISDDSVNIEQNLNAINQRNLSSVPENKPASLSERLSNMSNDQLRQSLDQLAQSGSVSKLSLQMSNPQSAAAKNSNAAALANLPVSGNKLAALGATSPSSGPATTSVSTQASTESVIKYRQSQQNLTGNSVESKSQELLDKTSGSRSLDRVSTDQALAKKSAVNAQKFAQSAGSKVNSDGVSVAGGSKSSAAALTQSARELSGEKALTEFGNNRALGSRVAAAATTSSAALGTSSSAESALAADANTAVASSGTGVNTNGLGASGSALVASVSRHNAAFASTAIAATLTSAAAQKAENLAFGLNADELALVSSASAQNSAMQQALSSLKQGLGLQPQYTQGFDPRQYAASESAALSQIGAMNSSSSSEDTSLDHAFSQDNAEHSDSTAASAAVAASAQAASNFAQSVSNLTHPSAATLASASMSMSSSASENAKELHEKVMQMAARNLKQLSVDLTPNNLGRMRIEISLDKSNDALAVSLAAASPEARKALQEAIPQLSETLSAYNIETDEHVYELATPSEANAERVLTQDSSVQTQGVSAETAQEFFAQRRMAQRRIKSSSQDSGIVFAKTSSHEVIADNLTDTRASAKLSEAVSNSAVSEHAGSDLDLLA